MQSTVYHSEAYMYRLCSEYKEYTAEYFFPRSAVTRKNMRIRYTPSTSLHNLFIPGVTPAHSLLRHIRGILAYTQPQHIRVHIRLQHIRVLRSTHKSQSPIKCYFIQSIIKGTDTTYLLITISHCHGRRQKGCWQASPKPVALFRMPGEDIDVIIAISRSSSSSILMGRNLSRLTTVQKPSNFF